MLPVASKLSPPSPSMRTMVLSFSALARTSNPQSPLNICAHFSRWPLEVYVENNGADSKSVALFFPVADNPRATGELSQAPFSTDGASIPVVLSFCYLGFDLHWHLSDDFTVEGRISKSAPMIRRDSEVSLL